MLSLSPRYDLFRFELPKDFLPKDIEAKYGQIINRNPGVIKTPIDYLNESIQGVTFPGIGDLLMQQSQHSTNSIIRTATRINVEPSNMVNYNTSGNPLENINRTISVQFRMNQGLYNYFMLYETIFYRICKPIGGRPCDDVFFIDILDESGRVASRLKLLQVYISGIEGLDFTFNKITRDTETFTVEFAFNNIDFDFMTDKIEKDS